MADRVHWLYILSFIPIRTKIYLLLGFLVIPVAICAALLCYTLSDTSFGDVPWVTEFVGLTAERISATAGISADSLADSNVTQVGGEIGVSLREPDSQSSDIYVGRNKVLHP